MLDVFSDSPFFLTSTPSFLFVFLLPFFLSACLSVRLLSCMLLYIYVMSSTPSLS